MKDAYEIYLLELRQCLKDEEEQLLAKRCVDIAKYRGVQRIKELVQSSLTAYRINNKQKNLDLIKFMEG